MTWEKVGQIFDTRSGCYSCPSCKKFKIYVESTDSFKNSEYCEVLANIDRKPEECTMLKKEPNKCLL